MCALGGQLLQMRDRRCSYTYLLFTLTLCIFRNLSEAEAANTTDQDVRELLQRRQSDFAMRSSSSLYPPIPPAYNG
jgi:hypothetical protein